MSGPSRTSSSGSGKYARPAQDAARAEESVAQLGFFFEDAPGLPLVTRAAPVSRPAPPKRKAARVDTLPPWARAAMPAAPVVREMEPVAQEDEPAEQEGEPSRRVWRVVELVSEVRGHIENAYADLWVRGEISNLRAAPSGHLYFTLKDGDASLPAVMFRRQAQLLRFRPTDGLEVLLRGRVSVYEQRGQMQLVAEYLEPVGAGSLQLAFEQLKRKLEAEGLFAMDRKRPLPAYPHCIGIVTSPSGAVIRDFLNVAGRRHAALDVLLYPAAVQGDCAAAEIAAGVAWFADPKNHVRTVDVIVVARGGGSLEDLAAFNSEAVARAIAASAIPVVSAVGHETDFTIADFVADLRAPTPSAAAELITAAQHRIEEHIDALEARARRAVRYTLSVGQQRYAALSVEAAFARVRSGIGRREQRLDEQRFRLERAGTARLRAANDRAQAAGAALLRQDATHRLRVMRERFGGLALRLESAAGRVLAVRRQQHLSAAQPLARFDLSNCLRDAAQRRGSLTSQLQARLTARLLHARTQLESGHRTMESLSPLAVLGRGYALVFAADGTLLKSAGRAGDGDALRVQLADGNLRARVVGEPGSTETSA